MIKILNLAILLLFVACSPRPSLKVHTFRGQTMGTTYFVKFVAPVDYDLSTLETKTNARLRQVNQAMSTYIKDSEISKFNKAQSGVEIEISKDFNHVLSHALTVAKKTSGIFDPTIGPLVNLWGFGPIGIRKVPSDNEISKAKSAVGFLKLSLQNRKLSKSVQATYIDLSASAKGFGVDAVLELVNNRGISNAMVEIGGEIRTSGRSLKRAWRIGVESPDPTGTKQRVLKVVQIENVALATSGDYRNFFKSGGKRYSHTLDHRTGKPVQSNLASVSVISDTCMDADAWATALMAMGTTKGFQFASANGIKAFFIYRTEDGSGDLKHKATLEFKNVIK